MQFDVIDTKTGAYPDVEKIALNEEWAKGLIYCDIDCFAMQEDGNLVLIDDCGNFAYPPEKRFKVILKKEPNEPLTLEQLREMDGEPVWIVDVGPHKWYGPGWAIVDRDNCLVRTAKNWNPVFFERYGERWLAYSRPPEGEEDT